MHSVTDSDPRVFQFNDEIGKIRRASLATTVSLQEKLAAAIVQNVETDWRLRAELGPEFHETDRRLRKELGTEFDAVRATFAQLHDLAAWQGSRRGLEGQLALGAPSTPSGSGGALGGRG